MDSINYSQAKLGKRMVDIGRPTADSHRAMACSRQSSTDQTCNYDTNGSHSIASMYIDDNMGMDVSVCTNSKTTSISQSAVAMEQTSGRKRKPKKSLLVVNNRPAWLTAKENIELYQGLIVEPKGIKETLKIDSAHVPTRDFEKLRGDWIGYLNAVQGAALNYLLSRIIARALYLEGELKTVTSKDLKDVFGITEDISLIDVINEND